MSPGPFTVSAVRGRGVATALGASLLLVGLVAAARHAPAPGATAELPMPAVMIWLPLMTAPLLCPHWLPR
jgi:hypothetical protein